MTLTTRLTLILLAVFVGLCAALLHQSVKTTDRYFQDVTQELSAPIAMYIAENRPPFHDASFDPVSFRDLAATAMILNPSIEVYALDPAGRVVGFAESVRPLVRGRVDLGPLKQFIAGGADGLLLGDDPRDASAERIFSAAAVGPPQRPWGYIYIILDSSARQATTAQAWPEHALTFAGGGIAVTLLAGLLVTALLFGRITLPLRALAREASEFETRLLPARNSDGPRKERDEIARLRAGFERLRSRITTQVQALRLADKSRREWIAHLSHDLRTPLTTLQAHLETVLRRDGSASASERREGLARALLHCRHIRQLLAELFESARLEAPTLDLRIECFTLAELVQDAALSFRGAAEAQGTGIECHIEECDSSIRADIGLFQRLIENLLTNALKASRCGGAVLLNVGRVRETVVLAVSNTGAEPTADMLRVFNGLQEPALGASGLGLRIIAQILRLHGLRSRVEPVMGGGSLIHIEIPAATPEAARLELAR